MSDRRSFVRKVIYFCAIAALLLPLSWLSAPATRGSVDSAATDGGWLARLRRDNNLSQANLGEIDPASETIKLATLGLRGVAANILWEKANHYKKTEDWTNLSATLEQITKLQPNFISVWQFQAWNLSYNVSVEFDDYHDRYYWVIRGIDFLKEGEKYNEDSPRLLWDIGWFIARKIGRADEYKQFRRLFKADDDFHPPGRVGEQRDSWLVGKYWYGEARKAVDDKKKPLRIRGKGKSELIFYADEPMCQINYGDAIEKEGSNDVVARQAWRQAGREWHQYGNRRLLHSSGRRLRLNDKERFADEAQRSRDELDRLVPGIREKLRDERQAALSDAQNQARATPVRQRTRAQFQLAAEAERQLAVSEQDVAERIEQVAPDKAATALRLARDAAQADQQAQQIRQYRQIVNYEYWRTRCEFEQTQDALLARAKIYQGDEALKDANLVRAKQLYDEGLALWRKVLDRFPSIIDDTTTGDDLMDVIKRYRKVLEEIDEPFPRDFPLRDIIDSRGGMDNLLDPAEKAAPDERRQETPAGEPPPAPTGRPQISANSGPSGHPRRNRSP